MGLFRNMECRHLVCDESRTTIALEPVFWMAIDRHAKTEGKSWKQWAADRLTGKPAETGRASWLRVQALQSGK